MTVNLAKGMRGSEIGTFWSKSELCSGYATSACHTIQYMQQCTPLYSWFYQCWSTSLPCLLLLLFLS